MRTQLEGRSKFARFKNALFKGEVHLVSSSCFDNLGEMSKLDEQTRKYLRETSGRQEWGISNLVWPMRSSIASRSIEPKPRIPQTKKETKLEELVIPTQMRRRPASLSGLEAFPIPDQDMVNTFTKEFALSRRMEPPYTPFVAPELHQNKKHDAAP